MITKACEMCGKVVEMRNYRQKYCPDCAKEALRIRKRKNNKAYKQRLKDARPPADKTMVCRRCKKITDRKSPSQLYCPECAKEVAREWERKRYERAKQLEQMRERQNRQKAKHLAFAEIDKAARSLGMSYGQYTAMLRSKESL